MVAGQGNHGPSSRNSGRNNNRNENLRQAAKLKYANVETALGTVVIVQTDEPVPEGFRIMKIG